MNALLEYELIAAIFVIIVVLFLLHSLHSKDRITFTDSDGNKKSMKMMSNKDIIKKLREKE